MKIGDYETHPAADAFPLLEGDEFAALVEDIRENGMHEAIWRADSLILDGRNRLRACIELGIAPTFRAFKAFGPGHLLAFVWSQNSARRHLTPSQRAVAAAKLAALAPGRPPKTGQPAAMRQADAAKLAQVGERSTRRARAVLDHGIPELVAAVERGALSLAVAEDVAKLPPGDQMTAAIAAVKAGPGAGDRVARALLPREQLSLPAMDPADELLRAIESAIARIGATARRDDGDRGLRLAFRGRVYTVHVVQQHRTAG